MLMLTSNMRSVVTLFILPLLVVARPAHQDDHVGGAIQIVQPPAGYTLQGPATYYQGATVDMPFQLRGDSEVNGYVKVSLKKGKKVVRYGSSINVTGGYLDAPLTFQLDKVSNGTQDLIVKLFDGKHQKIEEVSLTVTVIKPKDPAATGVNTNQTDKHIIAANKVDTTGTRNTTISKASKTRTVTSKKTGKPSATKTSVRRLR
ncbi:hypothetical protein P389DRAFT_212885 [Cystobasidium minutum MCA 4210]|uniref:uncharacterized protein n=1 Tax=Cystobasidium minutum MCA 4210 TaxID=1397322 RepID=UPI0034CF4B34|eukprot:jgi/Rhomi1/212885/estExt_Genemark1.C_80097